MIVDLFNELQRPGPTDAATQSAVFAGALEQAELADRLGYGCWWSVEHHCTPEFSHSGAPELMNVAVAMRTSRLRVGQAGVLTPFRINHPLRVAERIAVLDHLSGGRAEVGLARSGGAEWATFEIEGDDTLAELEEAARLMVTAWTEPEFSLVVGAAADPAPHPRAPAGAAPPPPPVADRDVARQLPAGRPARAGRAVHHPAVAGVGARGAAGGVRRGTSRGHRHRRVA